MTDKLNNFINPKAKLGKSVSVEPFSFIDEDVEIGDNSWIGNNVTIYSGARIGKNVKIFPGAVISAIPQDLKFSGEKTTVEIGDNTTIRECATINRGTKDTKKTIIENLFRFHGLPGLFFSSWDHLNEDKFRNYIDFEQ